MENLFKVYSDHKDFFRIEALVRVQRSVDACRSEMTWKSHVGLILAIMAQFPKTKASKERTAGAR